MQRLQHVPGDRLALAVGVGGEDQLVGALAPPWRSRERASAPRPSISQIMLEVVVGIDRAVLGRQVADVAEGGQDLVAAAEILVDRLGLGGRFDDDDLHASVTLLRDAERRRASRRGLTGAGRTPQAQMPCGNAARHCRGGSGRRSNQDRRALQGPPGCLAALAMTALDFRPPKPQGSLTPWRARPFPTGTCSGSRGCRRSDIEALLDRADEAVEVSRQVEKKKATLRGRTQINLFFEPSTRTQASFEIAGKRLGADVMNMSVASSSVKKGETLIDTAATLNAMRPDIIIVRHHAAGAVHLLARKVDCSRGQCRRRRARASDAGAARRADDPPQQGPHRRAVGGDLRRHPAFARRPLEHHPAAGARRARARHRARRP